MADFGQLLRQLRRARKLTMEQAAEAAGLSRSAVNRWETGVNLPRLTELNLLLGALGASTQQKRALLVQMDAPRAQTLVRETAARIAAKTGIEPQPHSGDLLKSMRLRSGLSLDALAPRIDVTARTLQRWEKGEVFPSVAHLHRLCYVVGAREEEVITLTCGQFASPWHSLNTSSYEELEQQYTLLSKRIVADDELPLELLFLTLEAQVWGLAARTERGKDLLAQTYTLHSRYLDGRGRYLEAGRYSERALALLPDTKQPERFWVDAVIFRAMGTALSGKRHASRDALAQLRPWLALTPWRDAHAWLLSHMAVHLADSGAIDEGLALSRKAFHLVEQHDLPRERERRLFDYSEMLLQAGQSGKALTLLTSLKADTPYFDAHLTLSQTEAHLAVGESSAAQKRLEHFGELQQSYSLGALHDRAEQYAQRVE